MPRQFCPSEASTHEFDAQCFAAAPNDFAAALWRMGDKRDIKSASDFDGHIGAYLRAVLRNIRDPTLVIIVAIGKRNPGRLTAPPAHGLTPYLQFFCGLGHQPLYPTKD